MPDLPKERCVECLRLFPASEVMHLGDAAVCAECKPGAVAKLASGKPVGTFWRKGSLLVMLRPEEMVVFPARCARCNESLGVSWVDGQIVESPGGWIVAVALLPLLMLIPVLLPIWLPKLAPGLRMGMPRFPGYLFFLPLVLLIPMVLKMRRLPWRYALCEAHRQEGKRRQRWETVLVIGVTLGIMATMILFKGRVGLWVPVVISLGSMAMAKWSRTVRLKRRKGAHYFFAGCGPQFLAQFPEWPGER